MSNRRQHLTLMGLILAALVGALLLAIPGSPAHKKPTLGLDLQGGLEVVLKAVPPKGHTLTAADLDRSVSIMRSRIDKLGVSEPEIRKQGSNQIVIELAGVHDAAAAAKLIGKTAQLQFFDFEADVTGPSKNLNGNIVATGSLYDLLKQVQGKAKQGSPEGYYLFKTKKAGTGKKAHTVHSLVTTNGAVPTKKELLRSYKGKLPPGGEILAVPKGMTVVSCPATSGCLGVTQNQAQAATYYYLLKYDPSAKNGAPEMTGKELKLSGTRADFDQNGLPIVTLEFTGHGQNVFAKITKQEAARGKLAASLAGHGGDPNYVTQYAGHFAIVLDGVVRSTPYIDYLKNPDGIDSSQAQIDMGQGGSINEAKDLALVLQTGALPVNFQQIERTDVSATLGKDSLRQAWEAAAVGLLIVAIFLLVLYRFLGVVAVLGLAIYAALYYAAILLFNVTLTLPGFAGAILTIGVAADANVVIFERIKEEVRAGKSVRAAIAAGYAKGFHTIVDANVVTAITALVLFAVATAGVKGFALMLLIGTLISLFTAVAATRAMLGLLAGFRWFGNARFMGAQGVQRARWLQIDFMARRWLWLGFSGVIILVSAVSLATKGLNLGIDFKGGTQVSFSTKQPVSLSAVRKQTADVGHADAVVQGRGKTAGSDKYQAFQLRMKSLTSAQQSRLTQDLESNVGATKIGTKNVSSSFGRQIAHDAVLAIIVSLLLIVIYIAVRFDIKFAGPVIVAMLHDVLICVGIYSLVGREVSTSTVAAVLTVLGYSIYDTIIIFDRIRENIPLMRRAPFATIANVSLWETIRRSLATTLITLLPVSALLVFGGATLKDFAFALLVGIASGAYSSIFVAAPLLTMLKEREPDYRKRKAQAEPEEPSADGARPLRGRVLGRRAPDAGTVALEESEEALAAEPTPALLDVSPPVESASAQARREKRRQRRKTRPHGRAR
ncbi:MAG: protein translocase subunit SecD [Actinobacteria bacterium]|nr:MAG: protein translocase subunit SecD [Actinomycetota bacterium]